MHSSFSFLLYIEELNNWVKNNLTENISQTNRAWVLPQKLEYLVIIYIYEDIRISKYL